MESLFAWLLPQVRFEARGGCTGRLLELCRSGGIPLRRVEPTEEGFIAWVPARCYGRLHRPARRCRTRLRVVVKRGLAFRLRFLRGRWGLPVGLLAFALTLWGCGRFVWCVRYEGLTPAQARRLSRELCSMDIGEGSVLTQEKLTAAEGELFLRCPELGWLALNGERGRLTVAADPLRQPLPVEGDEPADLVAAADGRILEMNVQEGLPLRREGQTVTAGETLVSAARADRDGKLYYSHPLGTVRALVKRTYRCEQPVRFSAALPTGRLWHSRSLVLAGRELPLTREPCPFAASTGRESRRPLRLFGFALPGRLRECLRAEVAPQPVQLTADAAVERARWRCERALRQQFPDAELRTASESREWTETGVIFTWKVQFEADIARRIE